MIKNLILLNNLQPADVIVAKKKSGIGKILNHYIVYAGNFSFIGNINNGVRIIPDSELIQLLSKYKFVRIKRFTGTLFQRQQAVNRASSKIGFKYNLFTFNCEHFANWVQKGKAISIQVILFVILVISIITYKSTQKNK